MRILVTGGAGFIASHVVDAYVRAGHDVSVLDDLSTGKRKNLNPAATFFEGDITDAAFVSRVVGKVNPDILNHHAAHIHVGRSVQNPLQDAHINIDGTINLMQAIKENGICKRVIMASTGGAMYGHKETPFTEEMAPAPLSPYGVSKRSAELYFGFYHEQYGIPFVALRYANVYGPRQNPQGEAGVISIFSKNMIEGKQPVINGDGKQTRDYVFVDDVVKANVLVLNSNMVGVLNIGTGIETDVNGVFQLVNEMFGADWKEIHGSPRSGEQQTSSLSYDKAKRELGWEPSVKLADGIQMTVDWFKKNPGRV